MQLIVITIGLCITYFALIYTLGYFFENRFPKIPKRAPLSVALIFIMSMASYQIAFAFSNPDLSNRVLHGLGGGFVAFLVCFLAARDIGLKINRFQFFFISFLLVAFLGVANEILECILQVSFNLQFAPSIRDTWYDLISNTIGTLTAALISVPFFKNK